MLAVVENHCVPATPEFVSAVRRLQEADLRNCVLNRENAFFYSRAFEYTVGNSLSDTPVALNHQARSQRHNRHIRSYSNCRKLSC